MSHYTFSESADCDFDGWPDRWTRRRGPGFPHYVKIFISPEAAPAGDRVLRIEMDGGAATAYAPPVQVEPWYEYVLEGLVNTEGLQRDSALISLTFLDRRGQTVQTVESARVGPGEGWRKVRLGPLSPDSRLVRSAVIGVQVEPGSRADLRGAAKFADLWLGRLPRVSLSTGNDTGFLTDPRQARVTCEIGGLSQAEGTVEFELLDAFGARLAAARQPLTSRSLPPEDKSSPTAAAKEPASRLGLAEWRPPLPGVGFYRVRTTLSGDGGLVHHRQIAIAAVKPEPILARGEFGWSVPRGACPLPLRAFGEIVLQSGVHWLKYPVEEPRKDNQKQLQSVVDLIERLSNRGVEVVGVLDRPPDAAAGSGSARPRSTVAEWLSGDPKVWGPGLATLTADYRSRVGWWQLGRDGDTGFVGDASLLEKLGQIRTEFQQAGARANVGVGWDWMEPLPETPVGKPASLRFLAMTADPPLTPQELAAYLSLPQRCDALRWVTLHALSKGQYCLEDRVIDLVRQMVAAKTQGAAAAFFADPINDEHGLLDEDGNPGDLLLPWRTTALLLSGARPAGSLSLPQGSANQVFLRDRDAVMVVWNTKPVQETFRLGADLRQMDPWGRQTPPAASLEGPTFAVTPVPSFIVGIDRRVAQWQLGVTLAKDRIPAALSQRLPNELTWTNHFGEDVAGTVRLVGPAGWKIDSPQSGFRLAAGGALRWPFDIILPVDAACGSQVLRADFEIRTDQPRQFSVYLPIQVGPGEVHIDLATQMTGQGELEIRQRLLNDTDRAVRFRCELFAPGRRRLTADIVGPARGLSDYVYRLPDGKDLVGKSFWLRAEETDGARMLNYRFTVEE